MTMIRSLVSLLLVASASMAQPLPTVKDITERMQRRYEMVDDARAEFTQMIKLGYANVEQSFDGSLVFKKPNRYRIESEHQTVVTDGVTVWAYAPANRQVIVDRYKEQRNSVSPEEFLLSLPTSYYATVVGREAVSGDQAAVLKLLPKDDRSFIRSVRLWIVESSAEVRKIQILDQNETETVYAITSIRLNTNVPDATFQFSAPNGTEVVDLR
jgi:chaperone LolA